MFLLSYIEIESIALLKYVRFIFQENVNFG